MYEILIMHPCYFPDAAAPAFQDFPDPGIADPMRIIIIPAVFIRIDEVGVPSE